MHAQPKILIVDPDEAVHREIGSALRPDGYGISSCHSANLALRKARDDPPDLILMEAVLPDGDGVMICQELRKLTDVPILLISGKCSEMDKIMGLMAGADDYIGKPYSLGEVVARIKVHLRRSLVIKRKKEQAAAEETQSVIRLGPLAIDLESCTVEVEGRPVQLTTKEFKVLVLLAENPRRVFQPEEIYRSVWGYDGLDDFRTVAVHISTLRKKIQQVSNVSVIQNVRGIGYRMEVASPED
jgi:DNA-binding response OmpR family regulator